MIESNDHPSDDQPIQQIRSRREALRLLLSDGDWHPSYECAAVGGVSFQAAIYAFRQRGWEVEARHVHGHLFEYRITGRCSASSKTRNLSQPQLIVLREVCLAVQKTYGQDGLSRVLAQLPPRLQEEARRL